MQDFGKLVLRACLGILLLFHGIKKISGGIAWIAGALTAHGLPPYLSWGVYAGEVLAPVLLIVGFLTRPAALVMVLDMLAAVYLVRMEHLTAVNATSGAWSLEAEGLFLFGALAVFFLGSGRFALSGGRGRLN